MWSIHSICIAAVVLAPCVSAAWLGAEGAKHLPTDSQQTASATRFFPFSIGTFFQAHYDQSMLLLKQADTGFNPELLWSFENLADDLAAIAEDGRVTGIDFKKAGKTTGSKLTVENYSAEIDAYMARGESYVLRYEYVTARRRPLKQLADALFNLTGIPASIHLYASAAGAQVLNPHTDPYDVLVWQQVGSKQWRACVPREEMAAGSFGVTTQLSDAQRCLLQELARDSIEGCTTYTVQDTASLKCEDFEMAAGDVLYMPKGVVHYAETSNTSDTYHLTIGLHRVNRQWVDTFHYLLLEQAAASATPPAAGAVSVEHALMELYSDTAEGVHLQEAVPGWLLECFRPWYTSPANGSDAELCASKFAELRRIFLLHVDRFGSWVYKLSHDGPWGFAVQTADRDRRAGEQPDLEHVSGLFWWTGDLTFLTRLVEDEAAFRRELGRLGAITEFKQADKRDWKKRQKRRQREVRSFEDAQTSGARTLCNEMADWRTECEGGSRDLCEVFINDGSRMNCNQYCEAQGTFCIASWDNSRESVCTRARPGANAYAECKASRGDHICLCQRECRDLGPWPCGEEGCPDSIITCEFLAKENMCQVGFKNIWRKAPSELADLKTYQACPMSCGECMSIL